MIELKKEIETLINKYSRENISDTPDFVLAQFLLDSLKAYEQATQQREAWYGNPRTIMEKNNG